MKQKTMTSVLARLGFCAALLVGARLCADTVEVANGTKLIGKITKIHGGVITLETDYAGELSIKQVLVTKITTDHAVAVRFADGTGQIGVISAPTADKVHVRGATNSADVPVGNVAAIWAAGEEDPDVVALRRKWAYELDLDVNGQSGTQTGLSTALGYKAALVGPLDTFKYYGNYLRQETSGAVSADQAKAGVDYSDNFTAKTSWYVRDEIGFDRVNSVDFYDVAAGGLGYDFIKETNEVLTGRAGLSYRYDEYAPGTPSLSSLGADFELEYMLKLKNAQLHDKIAFVPAFQDLGNYIITHELSYDVPIAKSHWKLSMGVSNDYNSRPVDGVDKLETLYFTRLVLAWGEGLPK
jgi:putative salt-induced outer membrane protein YdiY